MKPEEINRAIVEWCGWKPIDKSDDGKTIYWWRSPKGRELPTSSIPNYYGDLNACAEFQSRLDDEQQYRFCEELAGISVRGIRFLFRLTNATAPERCEALLRTLGLWRDE